MQAMQPQAAAWLLLALLVDAAAETFWSGSPIRWWVFGGVVMYAAAIAVTWRRTSCWAKAWASFLLLMTMLAVTVWLPGGLTDGVRLVGLSTGRVLALSAAAGVALAGIVLLRVSKIPRAARWAIAAFAAYGLMAFAHGAMVGAAFPELLAGQSLWRTLPFMLQGTVIGGLILLPLALVASVVTAGLRSPAPGSSIRTIRQVAALGTSLAIVVAALPQRDALAGSSPPVVATGQASTSTKAAAASPERLASLENSFRAIEDGLRESPRDRWDPDYVVQQVGTDPQRLFEWVRDNTSWIPYRGALRGAVGVLNDRLGNSLDRAVLLATLLQKAGHDVRLARRELSVEQGLELTSWAVTGPSPDEASMEVIDADEETPDAEIPAIAAQYQLDPARVERTLSDRALAIETLISDLDARVEDQTRRLLSMIEPYDAIEEWQRRFEVAVAALRDHWWVQRRDSERWIDLDTFTRDGAGGSVKATPQETMTLAELAPLYHELAVRVIAEQWSAGTRAERQVIEYVLRPAEVIGQPIVVQFWPSDFGLDVASSSGTEEAFLAIALKQTQWDVGLTIGRDVVAQSSISSSGDVVNAHKGGPMGIFGQRLTQSLSGRQSEESGATLAAVWLEYEVRSPSESARRIRREIFDLIGQAGRTTNASPLVVNDSKRLLRSLSLMMRTEVLPTNCRLSPEFVAHLTALGLLADRNLLRATVRGELVPGAAATKQLLDDAPSGLTPLYSLALARTEWSRYADQIFINRLNVLTRHRFPTSTSDGLSVRDATDIVATEVEVALSVSNAFPIRLEQGVLETNVERLLNVGAVSIGNTAEAFAASPDWAAVSSLQGIERLRIPDDARRRIADDLYAGYTVVASQAPVTLGGEAFVGWWRINGATGDTIGVASNGWGQAMAERGVQYSVFREMAKRFVFDYLLCQAIPVVANAARPMVTDLFGTPDWVRPPAQKTSRAVYEETSRECLISAIVSGAAFATLPLLLATLKYAGKLLRPFALRLWRDNRGAIRIPPFGSKPVAPHLARGLVGEKLAAEALSHEGHSIIAYKPHIEGTNQGGIDMITLKNGTVHFVDNKALTRSGNVSSVSALTKNFSKNKGVAVDELTRHLARKDLSPSERSVLQQVLDAIDRGNYRKVVTNANITPDNKILSGVTLKLRDAGIEFIDVFKTTKL